jgi:hypothetical protein
VVCHVQFPVMPMFARKPTRSPRDSLAARRFRCRSAQAARALSVIAACAFLAAASAIPAQAATAAQAAPSASPSPPSHMIAGAPALVFGAQQAGGGAGADFWRIKLVGGDQVKFAVDYPVNNEYEFDIYAPGTTGTTFGQATPLDNAETNPGTDTGVITLQAPYTGNFILAVCENPDQNCTSSAFNNSTNPMNPYTFTPGFIKGPGTTVTFKLSASRVAYGSEKSLKLSVAVSTKFSGPLAGTVTLKAGRKRICAVSISSAGKGTCSPSSWRLLAVGTYSVTAFYGGTASFPPSSSKSAKLIITKKKKS